MKKMYAILLLALAACHGSEQNGEQPETPGTPTHGSGIPAPANLNFTITATHPHDTSAYTQGLQWHQGKLYEGTGDYENSSLRITDMPTGKVEQKHLMGSNSIFGEGITIFGDKIYQLTWQSHKVYVYKLTDINNPIQTFDWPYDGWGITHNGKELIVSDGSSNLYFVNPSTFKVTNTISVTNNLGPVQNLNELEYVNGFIFANVYETDYIVKIDPESGHVVGILNFPGLLQPNDIIPNHTDVLNGIAYDSSRNIFFITGKRWPKLFELKLN
ncbi:MAG TPA: glutaminyl-peptide cyclotransferase [Ferruginibacter sp.]|nr:glutaminyl-peptide cyclotransferase [Ferruginibacter sp.]